MSSLEPGKIPSGRSSFIDEARAAVDAELARLLADRDGDRDDPGRLREAMRYAVLGGGKRLRPAVAAAACLAAGGSLADALPAACAVELLHAYTLVHDDLPAMDDDQERRGKPTVHVAFGEAQAILAGDALLTAAFAAVAPLGPDAVGVLARRAGAHELLAGQARDIAGAPGSLQDLEIIHKGKTGALFAAAAELGGIAAGAGREARGRLADFGLALGIAFQHADDLADGDHPEFATAARRRVDELLAAARDAIAQFGDQARHLLEIADRIGS